MTAPNPHTAAEDRGKRAAAPWFQRQRFESMSLAPWRDIDRAYKCISAAADDHHDRFSDNRRTPGPKRQTGIR